jgi:hypothetical protein
VPLLEPSLKLLQALADLGANDVATGLHAVKPLFEQVSGHVSASWSWCRGLCRVLVREGWLGRGLRTIAKPERSSRKRKRGKKRRNTPTETRVEVLYVSQKGQALLAYASEKRNGRHGTSGTYEEAVRDAVASRLTYWPDLDMEEESRKDPHHLHRVASGRRDAENHVSNTARNASSNAGPYKTNSSTTSLGGASKQTGHMQRWWER